MVDWWIIELSNRLLNRLSDQTLSLLPFSLYRLLLLLLANRLLSRTLPLLLSPRCRGSFRLRPSRARLRHLLRQLRQEASGAPSRQRRQLATHRRRLRPPLRRVRRRVDRPLRCRGLWLCCGIVWLDGLVGCECFRCLCRYVLRWIRH